MRAVRSMRPAGFQQRDYTSGATNWSGGKLRPPSWRPELQNKRSIGIGEKVARPPRPHYCTCRVRVGGSVPSAGEGRTFAARLVERSLTAPRFLSGFTGQHRPSILDRELTTHGARYARLLSSLMDMDFVHGPTRPAPRPQIRFLYIGPYSCSALPSDPTAR
jgi:hypothetical protein